MLRLLRGQRAQTATEFALVSPILFFLFLGIIDFGRVIYIQATLNQAANEGARVAVRGEPPFYAMPTDQDVQTAVEQHAADVYLANPCPNGPIPPGATPPANQGWLFITEAPAPTAYESPVPENAPGNGYGSGTPPTSGGAGWTCNAIQPAAGNAPLQVTIYYNFVPLTPFIRQVTANQIILKADAVYRTEY